MSIRAKLLPIRWLRSGRQHISSIALLVRFRESEHPIVPCRGQADLVPVFVSGSRGFNHTLQRAIARRSPVILSGLSRARQMYICRRFSGGLFLFRHSWPIAQEWLGCSRSLKRAPAEQQRRNVSAVINGRIRRTVLDCTVKSGGKDQRKSRSIESDTQKWESNPGSIPIHSPSGHQLEPHS